MLPVTPASCLLPPPSCLLPPASLHHCPAQNLTQTQTPARFPQRPLPFRSRQMTEVKPAHAPDYRIGTTRTPGESPCPARQEFETFTPARTT